MITRAARAACRRMQAKMHSKCASSSRRAVSYKHSCNATAPFCIQQSSRSLPRRRRAGVRQGRGASSGARCSSPERKCRVTPVPRLRTHATPPDIRKQRACLCGVREEGCFESCPRFAQKFVMTEKDVLLLQLHGYQQVFIRDAAPHGCPRLHFPTSSSGSAANGSDEHESRVSYNIIEFQRPSAATDR